MGEREVTRMGDQIPIPNPKPNPNISAPTNNATLASTTASPNLTVTDKNKGEVETTKGRKSIAWEHFTKLSFEETKGEHKAKCNHCRSVYGCHPTKHGTTSMIKHLKRSHKGIFTNVGKKATLHGYMPKINEGGEGDGLYGKISAKYNLEDCRKALTEFIICDEMSFKVVEGRRFRKLLYQLEPRFTVLHRMTISRDCYRLFLEEKKKLKAWLNKSCVRVSLTTDCWPSNQNLGYMCLTAHFIDEEWNLQKRIINFCQIENHKGETIGREIERCLREWGLDHVMTITVDNATSNDGAISYLSKKLESRGGLVCGGKYLHMRCCAHILNLVVNEGLKEQQSVIECIRNIVWYVRSSPQGLKKFKECIEAEMIVSQSFVCLDVSTRWNSTYIMLEHAEKFEKAFDRLCEQKSDLRKWFHEDEKGKKWSCPPTASDWHHARIFVQFLKIFYDVTLSFSGSLHVTSNKCFHEITFIQFELISWSHNQSELLGTMACSMRAKYDKYWGSVEKFNPLLFIAVVLDPQYKLDYVSWSYEDIYDKETADSMSTFVKHTLDALYQFYSQGFSEVKNIDNEEIGDFGKTGDSDGNAKGLPNTKGVSRSRVSIWKKQKRAKGDLDSKPDLEKYLAEDTIEIDDSEEGDFNILHWWKANSSKYKILSQIARDVLAILVSTVASESCFSTGGRVLDVFRSSLSPKMTEALICSQNWLSPSELKFDDQDFNQFDNTEKIVADAFAYNSQSQGTHEQREVMNIDT